MGVEGTNENIVISTHLATSSQATPGVRSYRLPKIEVGSNSDCFGVLTTQGSERVTSALRIPLQQESGRSIRCTYSWRRERHDCGGRFLRDNFAFHDTTTDFHRKGKSLTGAILGDHFRVTGERERTGGGDRERRDGDVHNGD